MIEEEEFDAYPTINDVDEECECFMRELDPGRWECEGDELDEIYEELVRLIRADQPPANLAYIISTPPARR